MTNCLFRSEAEHVAQIHRSLFELNEPLYCLNRFRTIVPVCTEKMQVEIVRQNPRKLVARRTRPLFGHQESRKLTRDTRLRDRAGILWNRGVDFDPGDVGVPLRKTDELSSMAHRS